MNFVSDKFGKLWPIHVESLIRLLSRLRAAFDGDLDSVLILAVIGSAALSRQKLPPEMSYEEFQEGTERETYRSPLNTNSISEITAIPRETVRRKLSAMRAKGWIVRNHDGYWQIAPQARDDLQPMTELSLEYLMQMAATIENAR